MKKGRWVKVTPGNEHLFKDFSPGLKEFLLNEKAIDDSIQAVLPQLVEMGILDPSDLPSSSKSSKDKVEASHSKYLFDLNEDAIVDSLESVKSQLESWGVLPKQPKSSREKIATARKI